MTTTAPPTRRDLRRAPERASASAEREQVEVVARARARRRERERAERLGAASRRARSRAGAVDLVVVAILVLAAATTLRPVWGGAGPWLAVLGGLVLGLGLAWFSTVRRWGVLTVAALTCVLYLALGGALALPATTLGGVVPTLATVRRLLLGTVTVWKDWVTVAVPVGAFEDLAIAPFLATVVAALVAASLALRTRRGTWALVALGCYLVVVVAGSSAQVVLPVVQGLVIVVVALAWAAWRLRPAFVEATDLDATQRAQRSALRQRRVRGTAALLGGTALVTAVLGPLVSPDGHRWVLRDAVVPPLEIHDFASPLVGYRSYVKDRAEDVLFTIEGLPPGERVRLATLDAYTGTVMDVAGGTAGSDSGAFRRAGSRLPTAPPLTGPPLAEGTKLEVRVTVHDYGEVWLPVVGEPVDLRFTGPRAEELRRGLHLNPSGPTALATAGLRSGDSFTLTATVRPRPSGSALAEAGLAELDLPAPQLVPDAVAATADRFARETAEGVETVQALRDGLAGTGVLSSGKEGEAPSRAGHGADRIATLLAEAAPVGDDEQFAVAMALMARQRGIPARVVMGFVHDGEEGAASGGPVELRGADVRAWVEVPFEGLGWVPFDPRPDDATPPQSSEARSEAEPQPQQLLEPQPPEEPEEPPTQPLPEDAEEDELETEDHGLPAWVRVAALATGGLLLLALPFVLVAALKARRRARRRKAEAMVERVLGGWHEVVDLGLDLGHEPRAGATRRETGGELANHFPEAGVAILARRADAGVFGPGEPRPEDVEALWREVDEVLAAMSRSVGPWARVRARFSLRSLRRRRPGGGGR